MPKIVAFVLCWFGLAIVIMAVFHFLKKGDK